MLSPLWGNNKASRFSGELLTDWQLEELAGMPKVPTKACLSKGFVILGCRPKTLRQLLAQIQAYPGTEIDEAFLAICANQARTDANEFLTPIWKADPLTQRLFTEIAKAGPNGCNNLFAAHFLKRLTAETGSKRAISASTVQSRLTNMQKKDWIFSISHGSYAASDPQAARVWAAEHEDAFGRS